VAAVIAEAEEVIAAAAVEAAVLAVGAGAVRFAGVATGRRIQVTGVKAMSVS
jgi:hypothetical protein